MTPVALSVIHCSEDELAGHIAEQLFDRAVSEVVQEDWIRELWAPTTRASARLFVDLEGRPGRSNRTDIKNSFTETGRRFRFHLRGLSGNAALAYKCYRLASMIEADGDHLLLLSFDTDHKPEEQRCSKGIQQARGNGSSFVPCVIAEASPEFDAWILAGFAPCNEHERNLLASACSDLGFDPVSNPHMLTSTVDRDVRDAKRVCMRLLELPEQAGPEHEKVLSCLEAPLPVLRLNGGLAGLDAFIRSIESEVLATLGGTSAAESA